MKILLILFLIFFTFSASAQNNAGRMADGRAFRIDNQGLRVVDHLAELEVRNKELKSKVISLKDSVVEKNSLIQSLRAGVQVPTDDKLKEQDLLGVTSSGLPKAATDESIALQKSYDCEKEIEVLRQEISKLRSENQQISLNRSVLHDQIKELESKPADMKESRASLSIPTELTPLASSNEVNNKTIKKILSTIQAKIMKRKNILDKLTEEKRGVSIKASILRTKSGLSLDNLRHAVNTGSKGSETFSNLKEIESILDDDIFTVSRLKH